ncbi:MAG: hypothetical protein V3T30_01495, partial [Thermodesulfobacteriota bacterium]
MLFLTFLVFIFALSSTAYSASDERKIVREEKELEDVKQRIKKGRESVEKIAVEEMSILGELETISKTLTRAKGELKKTSVSIKRTTKKISIVIRKIRKLSAERKKLLERLGKRLRAIYMFNQGAAVEVLFSSASGGELGLMHKHLTVIMEADRKLISESEENLEALNKEKEKLARFKKKKLRMHATYRNKQSEAEGFHKKRNRVLRSTKRERAKQEKLVRELEGAAKGLTSLIESLKKEALEVNIASGFSKMKGRLMMPVPGKVVSFYGKVRHPKFKTVTFNNGIEIEASYGDSV